MGNRYEGRRQVSAEATATLPALPQRLPVHAVIQCAMDMETAPVLALLDQDAPTQELNLGKEGAHQQRFILGNIDGYTVLVVTSGIGLSNAASATTRALTLVDPKIVIAAGTTGGLHVDVKVGEIAVGTSTVYNGADATVFGYKLGQVPRMPENYQSSDAVKAALPALAEAIEHGMMDGFIVSGDSFMNQDLVVPVRENYPTAIGADMETCSMAQACWSNGVDWVSLRAVSDLCGADSGEQFHMEGEEAARHSADAVRAFLPLI